MIHRLSPIFHKVRSHTRESGSVHVDSYTRGEHRKKETHRLTGMKLSPTTKPNSFKIRFAFSDGGSETDKVQASEYKSALSKGIGYAKKQIASITLYREVN